jgi:hypothetical protein
VHGQRVAMCMQFHAWRACIVCRSSPLRWLVCSQRNRCLFEALTGLQERLLCGELLGNMNMHRYHCKVFAPSLFSEHAVR